MGGLSGAHAHERRGQGQRSMAYNSCGLLCTTLQAVECVHVCVHGVCSPELPRTEGGSTSVSHTNTHMCTCTNLSSVDCQAHAVVCAVVYGCVCLRAVVEHEHVLTGQQACSRKGSWWWWWRRRRHHKQQVSMRARVNH